MVVKVYLEKDLDQVVEPTEYKAGPLGQAFYILLGAKPYCLYIFTRPCLRLSYLLTLKDYTAFLAQYTAAFVENYQPDLDDYEDIPYSSFAASFSAENQAWSAPSSLS